MKSFRADSLSSLRGWLLRGLLLSFILASPTFAQRSSQPGLDRSRDFIEQQRQRSDQMMRDARARSDQMMRDAQMRSQQIRNGAGSSRVRTSQSSRSNSRTPRIRPRAIRGIIALCLLVFGGLWKLISSASRSSQPAPMYGQQGQAGPRTFSNTGPGTFSNASSTPSDTESATPNTSSASSSHRAPRQDDFQYDTTSHLSGLADKIKKR